MVAEHFKFALEGFVNRLDVLLFTQFLPAKNFHDLSTFHEKEKKRKLFAVRISNCNAFFHRFGGVVIVFLMVLQFFLIFLEVR